MRFVIDMNLSPGWVAELAKQGHDASHWQDIGAIDATDDEIIAWAAGEDRVVLTADLDFATAVATRDLAAPCVVQLRLGSTDPEDVAGLVLRAIEVAATALTGGAILTIEPGHVRLRPGPSQFSI